MLAPRPAAGPALAFLKLLLRPADAALLGRLLLGILRPVTQPGTPTTPVTRSIAAAAVWAVQQAVDGIALKHTAARK